MMPRAVWGMVRALIIGGVTTLGLSVGWVAFYGVINPSETVLMGMRAQSGQQIKSSWIDIDDISPHVVRAVIAAEDSKFCAHFGFDVEQIRKAVDEAEQGKRRRGASTISQQTAKNAFLWPGRTMLRKAGEAWFTLIMETLWPKRRVMEVYLNVAEWGDGLFGIEAAAQARFGKSARDLSATEASLLAAVLPNPNDWRVDPPGPYIRERAATLRQRMNFVRTDGLDGCVLPNR